MNIAKIENNFQGPILYLRDFFSNGFLVYWLTCTINP